MKTVARKFFLVCVSLPLLLFMSGAYAQTLAAPHLGVSALTGALPHNAELERMEAAFSPSWLMAHDNEGFGGHVFSKVQRFLADARSSLQPIIDPAELPSLGPVEISAPNFHMEPLTPVAAVASDLPSAPVAAVDPRLAVVPEAGSTILLLAVSLGLVWFSRLVAVRPDLALPQ